MATTPQPVARASNHPPILTEREVAGAVLEGGIESDIGSFDLKLLDGGN